MVPVLILDAAMLAAVATTELLLVVLGKAVVVLGVTALLLGVSPKLVVDVVINCSEGVLVVATLPVIVTPAVVLMLSISLLFVVIGM